MVQTEGDMLLTWKYTVLSEVFDYLWNIARISWYRTFAENPHTSQQLFGFHTTIMYEIKIKWREWKPRVYKTMTNDKAEVVYD
jgi:hypothetical protein